MKIYICIYTQISCKGTYFIMQIFFFFFDCALSMQKFPGQGLNLSHSSDYLGCSTRWATRELPCRCWSAAFTGPFVRRGGSPLSEGTELTPLDGIPLSRLSDAVPRTVRTRDTEAPSWVWPGASHQSFWASMSFDTKHKSPSQPYTGIACGTFQTPVVWPRPQSLVRGVTEFAQVLR